MPPLPPVEAALMQPLTNALAEAGKTRLTRERKERLQPVIAANGHQLVPNALSLLLAEPGSWDKGLLVSILEQTANANDSPWIVAAAAREWGLIPLAERLAPDATAHVLYEAWQEHEGDHFAPPDLIRGIVAGRVRPLFSLVLDQIAELKVNHWSDIFLMDGIADQENSKAFEIAFRDALSQCLKQKLLQHQHYELGRIARVALKHGVPEGIDGLLVSEASSPEKLRLALGDYLNLPKTDSELVSFLNQNHGRWQWNAALNKFELPKTQN